MTRLTFDDGGFTNVERWGDRGPILLAIHGMTSSRRSWQRLAERFAGRFRVVAYDQRGHGDSASLTGPMALERGVRDAEEVVAALGEPVDAMLGHSWGAAVAVIAGRRMPVRRVAAIDPMIRQVGDAWYREYLEELSELFALEGAQRDAKVRSEFADWAPLDVEAKVHAVHAMSATPIEGLWKENPPERWDLREPIEQYPKPLLLALAARGEGINDDETLEAIERHHSPYVEIATFRGAGHNIHRTQYEALMNVLNDWLART